MRDLYPACNIGQWARAIADGNADVRAAPRRAARATRAFEPVACLAASASAFACASTWLPAWLAGCLPACLPACLPVWGNGADKVKPTAKSRQAAPEIPKYRTRGSFSQWSPARLRPLSGAFIVGLAFNEQAERQIKAAVISRNPRLAGYPGAGVI
ncbi:hypothetical protein ALC56_12895 [Trachymyrmex septentrionalis]|uniref:Uncharacterized protein n=1 Tax=Trachymyrmex septentrionalis TaxID=34720 RepID=A0A195EY68_9HYME|nr:hypothetical protein ALC56_12895 [Trachymyrmex septentrionalis]